MLTGYPLDAIKLEPQRLWIKRCAKDIICTELVRTSSRALFQLIVIYRRHIEVGFLPEGCELVDYLS